MRYLSPVTTSVRSTAWMATGQPVELQVDQAAVDEQFGAG
jgi:hypothetical protein